LKIQLLRKGKTVPHTNNSTTKSEVRKDFTYARHLMQMADKMMSDKSITDFSESSELGQIALELTASVSTLLQWLQEQEAKGSK
jgi:hypothetical protein